jgi:hypothetical protein
VLEDVEILIVGYCTCWFRDIHVSKHLGFWNIYCWLRYFAGFGMFLLQKSFCPPVGFSYSSYFITLISVPHLFLGFVDVRVFLDLRCYCISIGSLSLFAFGLLLV